LQHGGDMHFPIFLQLMQDRKIMTAPVFASEQNGVAWQRGWKPRVLPAHTNGDCPYRTLNQYTRAPLDVSKEPAETSAAMIMRRARPCLYV
jgi:hypothetical protein